MPAIDARITAAETKLKQLKAERERIQQRQRYLQAKLDRKRDTRRKVLVGAVILAQAEHGQGEWSHAKLNALLDKVLTRTDDRALFDLAPLLTELTTLPTP